MRSLFGAALVAAGLLYTAPLAARAAPADGCESLAHRSFDSATVTDAAAVAPPFSVTGMDPPKPTEVSRPFCRVQGTIRPTADSDIRFEVWLPPVAAWNGKVQGVGNGGFAGSLIYPSMNRALEAGYAVSATDTGHTGSAIASSWALGHPEKITDFGWRAIHVTAVAARAVVAAYYGRDPAHAYFVGCSDGGREALMEAQRFPEDYDGIVAGAPANDWVPLVATAVWDEQALAATPESAIPPAKLPAITRAVLSACHGPDGYVEDPMSCRFDPGALECKSGDADTCLTAPQVATLRRIYGGPHDPAGAPVFPGFTPGSEAGPVAWPLWITGAGGNGQGSLQLAFGRGFFGDFVFAKSDWDYRTMNFGPDLALADKRTGLAVNATSTDLSRFRARGGRLIQYHGWDDPAIPPMSSVMYYGAVAKRFGGVQETQAFYRLFMAPGMQHCGRGPGPNAVGGVFGLPAPAHDARQDVVAALAHWVEDKVPPEQIVATLYHDNDPSKGIAAQRPWCAFPSAARYAGQGDRSKADSFACVTSEGN